LGRALKKVGRKPGAQTDVVTSSGSPIRLYVELLKHLKLDKDVALAAQRIGCMPDEEMAHAFEAISAKIEAQADYVCWRDSTVVQGRPKKNFSSEIVFPEADPGAVIAHRWRKRFCLKGEPGTIIDQDKLQLALEGERLQCSV
jgi:hypothetical protein